MKINDSLNKTSTNPAEIRDNRQTEGTRATGTGTAQGNAPAPAAQGTTASVNVNLSSQLQSVIGQLSSETNVFDTQKVEEIKSAIASGQFQVDTAKVADGLLKTVTDLLQKPKG